MAKELRFGICASDSLTGPSYKVRAQGENVYLMRRGLGHEMKASLHPGLWKFDFNRVEPLGSPSRMVIGSAGLGEHPSRLFARIVVTRGMLSDRPRATDIVWSDVGHDAAVIFECFLVRVDPQRPPRLLPPLDPVGEVDVQLRGERVIVACSRTSVPFAATFDVDDFEADALDRHADEEGRATSMFVSVENNVLQIIDSVELQRPHA